MSGSVVLKNRYDRKGLCGIETGLEKVYELNRFLQYDHVSIKYKTD